MTLKLEGTLRGTLLAVFYRAEQTWLAGDALSTDVVLTVYEQLYFREGGGSAVVADDTNSDTITYTGFDDTLNQLTGVAGLTHDYAQDDTTVTPLPERRLRYATVQELDEDDTVEARVPHSIQDLLPTGTLDPNSDDTYEVTFAYEESTDEWVIHDVLGPLTPTGPDETMWWTIIGDPVVLEYPDRGPIRVSGTVVEFMVMCDTAPISDFTVQLMYDGSTLVCEATIPAGQNSALVTGDFQDVVAGHYFKINVTAAGGADFVTGYVGVNTT